MKKKIDIEKLKAGDPLTLTYLDMTTKLNMAINVKVRKIFRDGTIWIEDDHMFFSQILTITQLEELIQDQP